MHEIRHKDITGKVFGKLTAIGHFKTTKKESKIGPYYVVEWLYRCDCGNEVIKPTRHILAGHGLSCRDCCKYARKQINILTAMQRRVENESRKNKLSN